MIALALALSSALAPQVRHLLVTTAHGVVDVPIVQVTGDGPVISLDRLARALSGGVQRNDVWVTLVASGVSFRFLAGSPVLRDGENEVTLPASSHWRNDSLLIPLAFVSSVLASPDHPAWHWRAPTSSTGPASLVETALPPAGQVAYLPVTHAASTPIEPTELPSLGSTTLKRVHRVTIDAGHGGTDSGNPGMFFPHGMTEKDVTLAVALLVRDELIKRGVKVTMTRTTDTLINLGERAPRYCRDDCDLFVSIHVNSLDPRPGFTAVHGFETYFLSDAKSADAARVARIENESVRFDTPSADGRAEGRFDFLFKDLQDKAFLRESQHAASLIQSSLAETSITPAPGGGIKQANFAVLRTARRPSILVEIGFATNRDDAQMMTGRLGQGELAASIARAVIVYLKNFESSTIDAAGPQ